MRKSGLETKVRAVRDDSEFFNLLAQKMIRVIEQIKDEGPHEARFGEAQALLYAMTKHSGYTKYDIEDQVLLLERTYGGYRERVGILASDEET